MIIKIIQFCYVQTPEYFILFKRMKKQANYGRALQNALSQVNALWHMLRVECTALDVDQCILYMDIPPSGPVCSLVI